MNLSGVLKLLKEFCYFLLDNDSWMWSVRNVFSAAMGGNLGLHFSLLSRVFIFACMVLFVLYILSSLLSLSQNSA